MNPVSVVGGGAWGIALATAAARGGADVLLHTRREGEPIAGVRRTRSLAEAAKHARLVLLTVPSAHVREVGRALGSHLDGHHLLVHGVRGLAAVPSRTPAFEGDDLVTLSTVLREETPVRRFGALGGPVLTGELSRGEPCVMVVASHYTEVLAAVRSAFAGSFMRIYTTPDLVGLEWASALTGILAVAIGFARGAGVGAGLVSAFAIRGVHEAARIAVAAGAEERTFTGLGGFGDLLAAIGEEDRPEVRLGLALARGEEPTSAIAALGERIEALSLAPRVAEFAARHGVVAPILDAVAHGLFAQKNAPEIISTLMTAPMTGGA